MNLQFGKLLISIIWIYNLTATARVKQWELCHCWWRLTRTANKYQLLGHSNQKSDIVTEQYIICLPSAVAFYGRHLTKLQFTFHGLLSETSSVPSSLLPVSDRSTCVRQTTAIIWREKAIPINTSTDVGPARPRAVNHFTHPLHCHCSDLASLFLSDYVFRSLKLLDILWDQFKVLVIENKPVRLHSKPISGSMNRIWTFLEFSKLTTQFNDKPTFTSNFGKLWFGRCYNSNSGSYKCFIFMA
jgi:hypothetical protein